MDKYKLIVNDPENIQVLWHKWLEIGFVLRGSGMLFLDSNSYPIQEKDIFVVNSYQIHSVELSEGGYLLSFLIAPEFFEHLLPKTGNYRFDCKSFLFSLQEQDQFDKLRCRLADVVYAWMKSRGERDTIRIHAQMALLVECMVQDFGQESDAADQKTGDRFADLVRYMNEFYKEDISLSRLAQREYMSQSYFSRLFQKEVGVNFTEYLTNIRLSHAVNLLEKKDMTVTDVAYQTGFKNVNSFIEYFKQKYGKTPGQYRRELPGKISGEVQENMRRMGDFSQIFEPLLTYRNVKNGEHAAEGEQAAAVENRTFYIEAKVNRKTAGHTGKKILHNWKTLMNVGYAKDILYADVQQQIRRMQKEIGFTWVRFHGLLDDDMMIYTEKEDGTPRYHFHYADRVLDFILKTGLKPVIEFSYMPSALAETEEFNVFQRSSNISFPKSVEKWEGLVRALMDHWTRRYGKDEMKHWLFVPFFHQGFLQIREKERDEDFFHIYYRTASMIRSYDPKFRIIGTCGMINGCETLANFLDFMKKRDCIPDILGFYCYHTAGQEEYDAGQELKLLDTKEAFAMVLSGDENYLMTHRERLAALLKRYGMEETPVFLLEWSNNIWQRDLCNDTCYKSAFIFKDILENMDRYQAFGYWTMSDFMEEVLPSDDLFHGGFGLFTSCGIPKSAYQALWLLNFAGDCVLAQGEGYLATEREGEIQVFLYNYCHYDKFYRYRHATELSRTNRYQVFLEKGVCEYNIQFKNMDPGKYRVTRYGISRSEGSVYDYWVKMGAPESPDSFERRVLDGQSYPSYRTWMLECQKKITVSDRLEAHGIAVYLIKKVI